MVVRQAPFLANSDPLAAPWKTGTLWRLRLDGSNSHLPHPSDSKPEKNFRLSRRLWQGVTAPSGFGFTPGQLECPTLWLRGGALIRPLGESITDVSISKTPPSLFHQSPIISPATDGRFAVRDGISALGDLQYG